MIKITSIEINGFITPSQSVKLDFVESNVICIYGNNGSGKTTLLEILFAVFDRDEKKLFEYSVNKIKIDYIFENNSEIVYIGLDKDEYGNDCYNFESLDNSHFSNTSSLFLGIGRGIHKKEFKIPKGILWHFFRNHKKIGENKILTDIEIDEITDKLADTLMPKEKNNEIENYRAKELDDSKNIYLPSIEIDTVEAFLNQKYKEAILDAKEKIEKALSQTSLNFLKSAQPQQDMDLEELRDRLFYNKSLLLEMFSDSENMGIALIFNNLEQDKSYLKKIDSSQQIILSNMINELQHEVELFKEIQLFVDEYNSFLNYDKELIFNSNGVFIAPENHLLEKLSSGERHLLTFLTTILLMGEEQDFILLDEPEISLNVDWQREILSAITKLVPNSQIIVATHSPLVARNYRKSVVGIEPKVKDEQ